VLDGSQGAYLREKGHKFDHPARLNLENPGALIEMHNAYIEAGVDIFQANTFNANRFERESSGLADKIKEANENAVKAARESAKGKNVFVAGSCGPLGKYAEPLGELTFEKAYENYAELISYLKKADLLMIETLSDIKIAKAAVIAAKDNFSGPIICTMGFEGDRTTTGTGLEEFIALMEAMHIDVIGFNCFQGPGEYLPLVEKACKLTKKPLVVYPNAGLPKLIGGKTVFPLNAEKFAPYAKRFAELGANIVGGCCGTTPEHIKLVSNAVQGMKPVQRQVKPRTVICSRTRSVSFDKPVAIGESINPTGQKDLRSELEQGKLSIAKKLALQQAQNGAGALDINAAAPMGNEVETLPKAVQAIENLVDLPLVFDSKNLEALEAALKKCAGKPLINSIDGSKKSIEEIVPLAKRYGAAVIALALDEKGIPKTAEGRIEIAKRIIDECEKRSLSRSEIIIDPLTITMATNKGNADITIEALKGIKKLGVKTVLGVSNISHGLPDRRKINFWFLVRALKAGLDSAIVNVADPLMAKAIENVGQFEEGEEIDFSPVLKKPRVYPTMPTDRRLCEGVIHGIEEEIIPVVQEALHKHSPLEVNSFLLQGMNVVGERFKKKEIFLPSVILSASTVKHAFSILKGKLGHEEKKNFRIVLATVKDDIHDIGKSILVAVLESYGFEVIDLGKSVSAEKIAEVVEKKKPDLLCLSALMTTTMVNMQPVIDELKKREINVPVVVGGAVLTKEYADKIGAKYAKDAIEAAELVKKIAEEN